MLQWESLTAKNYLAQNVNSAYIHRLRSPDPDYCGCISLGHMEGRARSQFYHGLIAVNKSEVLAALQCYNYNSYLRPCCTHHSDRMTFVPVSQAQFSEWGNEGQMTPAHANCSAYGQGTPSLGNPNLLKGAISKPASTFAPKGDIIFI